MLAAATVNARADLPLDLQNTYEETLQPLQLAAAAQTQQTGGLIQQEAGFHHRRVVDRSTMNGKVICGYQGWFNAPGDGADRGWVHWSRRRESLGDGQATFELWPDVSELSPAERFASDFHFADGAAAEVFSSFVEPTVFRHFQWMQEYNIDGVFVQRFATGLRSVDSLRHNNTVLSHCRGGASQHGRAYAIMYDLSGLGPGGTKWVIDDWQAMHSQSHLTSDPAYLRHNGQPVVAVWGVGFGDDRKYSIQECNELVDFFKTSAIEGGCTLMIGVPTFWRELDRDSITDPALHQVLAKADVISPWTVGRYDSPQSAENYSRTTLAEDRRWCQDRGIELMPVAFPGFSWHNLKRGAVLDQIPRRGGEFLWAQLQGAQLAGADMVYVAMFDEVDEATAIFKCGVRAPESNESKFLTFAEHPSDHYLRITGEAAAHFHAGTSIPDAMPSQP